MYGIRHLPLRGRVRHDRLSQRAWRGNFVRSGVARVRPIANPPARALLPVGESGSTYRFLLPYVAAMGVPAEFSGTERLFARPTEPLIHVLNAHGAVTDGKTLSGRIEPGEYAIRGDISSQYLTGLLLALPTLKGDSRIVVSGEKVSGSYLDVTLDVLRDFHIEITEENNYYYVRGNQCFLRMTAVSKGIGRTPLSFWRQGRSAET